MTPEHRKVAIRVLEELRYCDFMMDDDPGLNCDELTICLDLFLKDTEYQPLWDEVKKHPETAWHKEKGKLYAQLYSLMKKGDEDGEFGIP